jgi:hypothetical protein
MGNGDPMQSGDNDIVYKTYGLNTDFFEGIYDFLSNGDLFDSSFFELFFNIWVVYSILAFLLSAVFIFGIVYSYIRTSQMSEIEEEKLLEQEKMWKELHDGHIENERWQSVQIHLASENPNDWKLAIIEADVLLERLLDKAGYAGTTIGEKLKSASARSFATLDDAWQAHRVRNQIAHGGADFVLTQKLAKETLILYERVFKEFDFV